MKRVGDVLMVRY